PISLFLPPHFMSLAGRLSALEREVAELRRVVERLSLLLEESEASQYSVVQSQSPGASAQVPRLLSPLAAGVLLAERSGCEDFNPVRVYSRFADCKALVKVGSDLGDSVCVGLPSRGDVIAETVDGDPLTARDALAAGDGFEDALCPLAVLRCGVDDAGQEVLVQGLLLKEVEGRLVLAIPASAWHKKVNRRTLPKGFMTKVGAAEVLACAASSRSVPEDDAVLRVWFGLVEPSYEAAIEFSDEAPSVAFGALENGEAALPFVPALVAAVSDHYTFASAESGQPAVHKDALSARLDRLERLLGAAIPSGSQAGRAGAKAKAKVSAKAAARAAVPAPSVDPAVLLAARAAG
ncbi:DNAJ1, partial [Symbiodinium necroappetens]